ncbi:PREDICTED: uncharacterized protein LOC107071519 isoform X2 [Polistes dominula]|uniref:Uncharacterized protein LOC107071519 isoform X2 n=1 Tax=Polistes dominula TaxID=743375 RepID=A0ABM1J0R7_POLDO|nr:PREDICTED: uncharacterized protein LOC107071519 isoform X2 [Polistes dominula]
MDKLSKNQANHSVYIPENPGSSPAYKSLEKKKLSRKSMLPSSISMESLREEEAHSKDMDLQFLYNDYLLSTMLEHLTEKNSKTLKESIVRQSADITKACAEDEEELNKLKIREKDIINLSIVQTKLDEQIEVINDYIKCGKISDIEDIMSQLCTALKPLDILRCNNIILPEKTNEWTELHEILKKCQNTLHNIRELINTNLETYETVHKGIQDFTSTYNDIEACQKKLDSALQDLQITVLKNGSFSLE